MFDVVSCLECYQNKWLGQWSCLQPSVTVSAWVLLCKIHTLIYNIVKLYNQQNWLFKKKMVWTYAFEFNASLTFFCHLFLELMLKIIFSLSLEPELVRLHIDGTTDKCSLGEDINFQFKGFSIQGMVSTLTFTFNILIKLK